VPSVREAVRRYAAVSGTVARTFERLADAGVIGATGRRRSWGVDRRNLAALRLNGQPPGSDDLALDIVLCEAADGSIVTARPRSSFHGPSGLRRGGIPAQATGIAGLHGLARGQYPKRP
jgi:hypothetical protein